MDIIKYPQFNEKLYYETLPNGLRVYMYPMPGFSKTSAVLSVNYGSIDTKFEVNGQSYSQPEGIAHFLEHKMFDKKDYDVFELFNQTGARANAFTSFTKTNYLFTATSNAHENLDILLNFVMQPYFTKQKVEKEKGIIGQEINMYKNDPDNQLYFSAIQGMYQKSPLGSDIAGSIDSLNSITVDDVNLAYDTFYRPDNMTLFVSGNLDPDTTIAWIRKNQAQYPRRDIDVQRKFTSGTVLDTITKSDMEVSHSKLALGLKGNDDIPAGEDELKYELAITVMLNLYFSENAPEYDQLYHEGLIDDSFSFEFENERSFHYVILAGDTTDPIVLKTELMNILNSVTETITDKNEEFELQKREMLGEYVRSMDSVDAIANQFSGSTSPVFSIFDELRVMGELTLDDVINASKQLISNFETVTVVMESKP
ncbi:pitrilysin family protein [Lentilactobacillus sp. Marseille-Q4993]|uniref:EF-P 5-aminopentanol modification-associated protein YfmH n=1 Tax=Lentilactobacillus sp. Marseille-Q4993 TaxID=3039492 RepID=UPI0024BD5216|nr:pitrilysin family protein [Lentilactobacillus sp. Marseille-Q4993]